MYTPDAIAVAIVADRPLMRLALKAALADPIWGTDLRVVGQYGLASNHLATVFPPITRAVVLDPTEPPAALRFIRAMASRTPPIAVVAVTCCPPEETEVRALLAAGATSYLCAFSGPEEVCRAVRRSLTSQDVIHVHLEGGRRGPGWGPAAENGLLRGLSQQDQIIIALMAAGLSDPEIGQETGLSANTVKHRLDSLRLNLGCRNRTHLLAYLMQRGLSAAPIGKDEAPIPSLQNAWSA